MQILYNIICGGDYLLHKFKYLEIIFNTFYITDIIGHNDYPLLPSILILLKYHV